MVDVLQRLAVLFVLAALSSGSAWAGMTGRPTVIDGDTIEIAGRRIDLFGIDAPEARQRCTVNGTSWHCGQQAIFALAEFIGKAWVSCNERGGGGSTRITAVCYLGKKDINAWMVRNGWAFDDSRHSKGAYAAEQNQAQGDRLGIWKGEVTAPWDWRRRN